MYSAKLYFEYDIAGAADIPLNITSLTVVNNDVILAAAPASAAVPPIDCVLVTGLCSDEYDALVKM